MEKIVVYSGSFNPVTKAHYLMLSAAVDFIHADKGIFIPTTDDYLTSKTVVKVRTRTPFKLSEETRREMLESLHTENNKLYCGFFEKKESEALKKLIKEQPNAEYFVLVGADKMHSLSNWDWVKKYLGEVKLIVFPRDGVDVQSIIDNDSNLSEHKNDIFIIDINSLNLPVSIDSISSTELRRRFFNGEDYKDLMNDGPYKILSRYTQNDFSPISEQQIIEATASEKSRNAERNSFRLVYRINTKLFKKVNWNSSLFGDRDDLIKGTKVYKTEFKTNYRYNYTLETDCKKEDCIDVAKQLIDEGLSPAILNLASRRHPCGEYADCGRAQEESICRASTLSVSLYQFGNPSEKCVIKAEVPTTSGVYPMDINFGGIYSPKVCFFRYNKKKHFALRTEPFMCDVISVASLSNKEPKDYTNDEQEYFKNDGYMTDEGKEIEKNKIRTIYRIGLENGNDSLVLGAFGCGDFHLMKDEVANLFKEVLEEDEFKGNFKKIVFAILGKKNDFKPFYDIFGR